MRTVLTTPPLLWGATLHPSSNWCLALPQQSTMLGEVADLLWSAPYALEFLAYFGAAGFLLAAKRSEGARCLLYSLWVFLAPQPYWRSVARDMQTLRGWCWPFLDVPI
jgi:hypothetical protein